MSPASTLKYLAIEPQPKLPQKPLTSDSRNLLNGQRQNISNIQMQEHHYLPTKCTELAEWYLIFNHISSKGIRQLSRMN